ncbi:MAG: hypothetical protein PHE24_00330 [Patescibacteria group bacterium]|nr:hypothetical protein [Patescibacteria group bacterium]
MIKKIFYIFCLVLAVFLMIAFCGSIKPAKADLLPQIPLPTILSTTQIEESTSSQIQINGLVANGYRILIYINGKYNGVANISQINSDVAKFTYLSSPLNSNQTFEIMALAQNQSTLQLSAPASAIVRSVIERSSLKSAEIKENILTNNPSPINSPTLLTPRQISCSSSAPYISGFAISNSSVFIYIDNKLFSVVPTGNESSGTSFFSYSPKASLERGNHLVYAIAQDKKGNKSRRSNTLPFCISSPQIIATTTPASIDMQDSTKIDNIASNSSSNLVFQKTISNNLSNDSHKKTLNILIFAVFIAGLLVWMIFVNRELADENSKTDIPANGDGPNISDKQK